MHHRDLMRSKISSYVPRKDLDDKVMNYLLNDAKLYPLVVVGKVCWYLFFIMQNKVFNFNFVHLRVVVARHLLWQNPLEQLKRLFQNRLWFIDLLVGY